MVLIGNTNGSLSIEKFHKNRCIEKSENKEIKNITVQGNYESKKEQKEKDKSQGKGKEKEKEQKNISDLNTLSSDK